MLNSFQAPFDGSLLLTERQSRVWTLKEQWIKDFRSTGRRMKLSLPPIDGFWFTKHCLFMSVYEGKTSHRQRTLWCFYFFHRFVGHPSWSDRVWSEEPWKIGHEEISTACDDDDFGVISTGKIETFTIFGLEKKGRRRGRKIARRFPIVIVGCFVDVKAFSCVTISLDLCRQLSCSSLNCP